MCSSVSWIQRNTLSALSVQYICNRIENNYNINIALKFRYLFLLYFKAILSSFEISLEQGKIKRKGDGVKIKNNVNQKTF